MQLEQFGLFLLLFQQPKFHFAFHKYGNVLRETILFLRAVAPIPREFTKEEQTPGTVWNQESRRPAQPRCTHFFCEALCAEQYIPDRFQPGPQRMKLAHQAGRPPGANARRKGTPSLHPAPCRAGAGAAAREARYLGDSAVKLPPSSSRILQKRTPLTKGTEESSSSPKSTLNLNFFFFIIMRARRRRAGCGGGPKGRAGRRRLSSAEPQARPAPWPGPRAARGGAAGGRRGPAGAAAAASRGSPGRSAAAAAARERSCCSSPGRWAPFRCAAGRRRPSESREKRRSQNRRRRLRATGPRAPPAAAARSAPPGGSVGGGRGNSGRAGAPPGKPARDGSYGVTSLGVKKRQTQPKRSFLLPLPLSLSFSFCSAPFLPLPLQRRYFPLGIESQGCLNRDNQNLHDVVFVPLKS